MTKELEEVLRAAKTLSRPEKEELVHAIERDISSVSESERQRLVREIHGKYAGLPGSVDEFLARKRDDTERER